MKDSILKFLLSIAMFTLALLFGWVLYDLALHLSDSKVLATVIGFLAFIWLQRPDGPIEFKLVASTFDVRIGSKKND